MEAGDDLVIKDTSGTILEQDKHSLQETGHPFSDYSAALWKTLANWLDESKEAPYNDAKLFLVTNRPVPDCLARRLSAENKKQNDLAGVLAEIRRIASEPNESIARFCKVVAEAGTEDLINLVRRIRLLDASDGMTSPALLRNTASLLHIPDHVNAQLVLEKLLGWLHVVIKNDWDSGRPAWVTRRAFSRQVFSTLKHIDGRRFLERAERLIPVSEEDRQKVRLSRFVEHLSMTTCAEDEVDSAVDAFIRFNVEYSRLLEEGDIHPADWDERGGRLRRRWEIILSRSRLNRAERTSEELGEGIYYEVVEHRESLAGYVTHEFYLTSGHYQRLANSDEVWWNPDFPSWQRGRANEPKS
jgi:hypothetical protein